MTEDGQFVARSALRKLAVHAPVDAADALAEAQNIIDGMADWMRQVLPGQEQTNGDDRRAWLFEKAAEWKAGLK